MEDIELHSNRDRIEIPSYERRGLLSPTSEESKESNSTLHYSSTSLITNFSHITIYFSMIQCCIYYIQSLFIPFISIHNPSDLLGLGDMNLSGVFYICTAISSLLFSKAWTRSFETPNALLYAMFGMISYLVLLVFSGLIFWLTPMFFTSRIGKFFGILISSYGGCFYGFQWISFYKYFIQHTNSFKDATGLSFEDINSDFISRFLSIFLLYRCVTSIAIDITRTYFLFSIQLSLCILISIGAAYASLRVSDMENLDDEEDTIATPTVSPSINAMLKLRKSHEDNFPVVKLIYKDQMIFFYLPTHITIGFMYMFIIYYFLGSRTNQINSLAMPSNNLTYLIPFLPSIVNCFVYFIFIFPISRIMKAYNKSICNVLGLICLNIIPLFILFQSNKLTLLSLDASLGFILLLLILISLCLSIYESSIRGLIADFFIKEVEKSTFAFAACFSVFHYSFGMSCYIINHVPMNQFLYFLLFLSISSSICYYFTISMYNTTKQWKVIDNQNKLKNTYTEYMTKDRHSSHQEYARQVLLSHDVNSGAHI